MFVPAEREWLRQAAEAGRFRAPADPINPGALLDRLSQVEAFERFLQRTFPGKTRFSIEGLDMLVPVLDEVIGEAAESGIRHILIGMAHRGRLNVMAHVLNKPYAQILAEFKEPVSRTFREDMAWTGDVKYHAGALRAIRGGAQLDLVVSMPPNPSHLEAIDPVVEGMARAAGTIADGGGAPRFDPARSVPILIHGDAAFPGQGIVAETLNLSRLPGYSTGGTIHVIANNQLGFTTAPEDSYSTSYASGLARGFKIPIVHVNADDPEACVEAARLAFAYRARFHRDFLIDLIGYRRYGHNEGDEPGFTQPLMYQKIAAQPTVREIWGRTLVERGAIDAALADVSVKAYLNELQEAYEKLQPSRTSSNRHPRRRRPARPRASPRECRSNGYASSTRRSTFSRAISRSIASSNAFATRRGSSSTRQTSARLIGRARRNWRTRRFSATASASGSPARTSSAAPSAIAMRCSTTPSQGGSTCRCRRCRRRAPPSRSTTAPSPRTPSSDSSTATTSRSLRGS